MEVEVEVELVVEVEVEVEKPRSPRPPLEFTGIAMISRCPETPP